MVRDKNINIDFYTNYSTLDKLVFFLYITYFVLKPFYFWSSGLPQISDFVLMFLLLFYTLKVSFRFKICTEANKFLFISLIFVFYIVFVNLIWTLIFSDPDKFILMSIFYIYNFVVIFLVAALYTEYGHKLFDITYKAILLSVCFQIIMYFANGGFSGGRATAGFNNPNQLGYYALLVGSFLMLLSQTLKVKLKWFLVGVVASLILALVSLSKAAILSCIIQVLFYLFSNNRNKKFKLKLITIFIIISIASIYSYIKTDIIDDNHLLQLAGNRINSIGNDSDDSLEGRGYYRIIEFPKYWIFGSGEGLYSRFGIQNMELHSTLGNLQVSYGVVGLFLFLLLIYISLKSSGYHSWYIILTIFAYGLTHNGIRNSMLWILLVLIVVSKNDKIYKVPKV